MLMLLGTFIAELLTVWSGEESIETDTTITQTPPFLPIVILIPNIRQLQTSAVRGIGNNNLYVRTHMAGFQSCRSMKLVRNTGGLHSWPDRGLRRH